MDIWIIDHYSVPIKYYPLARQTNFARYLMKMGHSVKIFAASTVHNSEVNLLSEDKLYSCVVDDDVNYVLIRCKGYSGNGMSRMMNMAEFALKLPKVCRHFAKPDVIVSTSMTLFACAEGIRLGRKMGVRVVAQITDLWPETLVAYDLAGRYNPIVLAFRQLEKWIYTHADRIIFSMEGAYEYIREQGWESIVPREKVFFINNGVDLQAFNYNKEHFQIQDADLQCDKFKLVYTGSIRRVNNLGLLLDVAKLLPDEYLFLIWGDGDEREFLQNRVADEQISNVIFKGRVDKKFIPYITSMADVNIAHNTPTNLFRFGISFNKIFDYMAAGKPILSTFPCAYNPAVMHGAGIDVTVPDAAGIADRIAELARLSVEDEDDYCRNAMLAAEYYSFQNLTEKLVKVLSF